MTDRYENIRNAQADGAVAAECVATVCHIGVGPAYAYGNFYELQAQVTPGTKISIGDKLYTTPPPSAVPDGMIERIKAAEQRILDGHAPRRIPADPTDVDLVLAEVRLFLEGKPAPFWLAAAPAPKEAP